MLACTNVAWACSEDAANGGGDEVADDSGADAAAEAPAVSAGCSAPAVQPGDLALNIGGEGRAGRAFDLHVPPGYDGSAMPLVVNMHGLISNAMQQPQVSAMNGVADAEGFLVAYPAGAGSLSAWAAGDCCEFSDPDRDDLAFITAVIDDIQNRACVDLARVYATGFSNGGFMAHRMACELSDRIAAVASVAGVLGIPPEDCQPTRPMPVMQVHGTADPLVPFGGGSPGGWSLLFAGSTPPIFRSVDETIAAWLAQDGCSDSTERSFEMGDASCDTHPDCAADSEVVLCTIDGGGHSWPGGDNSAFGAGSPLIVGFLGKVSTSMNGSQAIWDFFERHPLPR